MRTRQFAAFLTIFWLTGVVHLQAQQANVNLDYNPQKNTENLIPFSAPLNSPDMYIYHFVIDGVRVADPSNTVAGFTAMPPDRRRARRVDCTATVRPITMPVTFRTVMSRATYTTRT